MTKNILRLDASMRKTGSYSRDLTDKLIRQVNLDQSYNITTRDLVDGIELINDVWIKANFTDRDKRTPEEERSLLKSDLLVEELSNADVIVIGLPIYNFGVPAAFKAWIDQVVRSKLTFRYTDEGPIGLLRNKKAYVIIASGGTELGSELDFISTYLHHILAFIGITEVTLIDSSGLGGNEEKILARTHELIEQI